VIAVILSGLGQDGTKGIAAISKNGGVIIAQEAETAVEASMPQGVISSGYADFILCPKDMPAQVIKSVKAFK
jgi:two-component system CheB/CheR fusion protein